MRLEDLDRDEDLRRREFPVAANKIFLAHAGVCALPHRVAQAMRDYLDLAERGDQEHNYYHSRIRETRELAAKLVGCEIGEVALVGPTSVGLSLVANGLDWKPGDELVAYFDDYPSNVYPWMRLKEQGVEVRFVRAKRPGEVTLRAVEEEMSARTRL
ncbi:MAG: aminotransferase class V-fold PLP-dependent enzyme, partial [Verrucomicrobiae bacterium]|nr:aminotransferase class V-fold PLP-dependent enzyme [Verrucomicrobiae bacterium]